MIEQSIFQRVARVINALAHHESFYDTILALNEEVGELSKAARIETTHCQKSCDEPAKIEAVDVMLCALEAYIRLGGSWDELLSTAQAKLSKYEKSVVKRLQSLERETEILEIEQAGDYYGNSAMAQSAIQEKRNSDDYRTRTS